MSVTVISPSGVVITFNEADWIKWDYRGGIGLFVGNPDDKGTFVARVPDDWIVSSSIPTRNTA